MLNVDKVTNKSEIRLMRSKIGQSHRGGTMLEERSLSPSVVSPVVPWVLSPGIYRAGSVLVYTGKTLIQINNKIILNEKLKT